MLKQAGETNPSLKSHSHFSIFLRDRWLVSIAASVKSLESISLTARSPHIYNASLWIWFMMRFSLLKFPSSADFTVHILQGPGHNRATSSAVHCAARWTRMTHYLGACWRVIWMFKHLKRVTGDNDPDHSAGAVNTPWSCAEIQTCGRLFCSLSSQLMFIHTTKFCVSTQISLNQM